MIPLPVLQALPWRLIGRIAAGLAVVACVLWIVAVLKSWHDDSQKLPEVRAELAQERKEKAGAIAEASRIQAVSKGYLDEIEKLRVRAVPARSVRLCVATGQGPTPAAAGGDAAAAGAGQLPQPAGQDHQPGPDIGADLYALMDEADRVVAACRAGQEYIRGLP